MIFLGYLLFLAFRLQEILNFRLSSFFAAIIFLVTCLLASPSLSCWTLNFPIKDIILHNVTASYIFLSQ